MSDVYRQLRADAAAEYLKEVRRKAMDVSRILAELDAYDDATGMKGTDYSAVKVSSSPNPDGVHRLVERHMELKSQHEEAAVEYSELFGNAKRIIDGLPDYRHRLLLSMYYLQGMRWHDVADRMGYEERHVMNLRIDALNVVHDLMPAEYQVHIEQAI